MFLIQQSFIQNVTFRRSSSQGLQDGPFTFMWYLEHSQHLYSHMYGFRGLPDLSIDSWSFWQHTCQAGITCDSLLMLPQYFSCKCAATEEAPGCYAVNPFTASTKLSDLNWFCHRSSQWFRALLTVWHQFIPHMFHNWDS